MLSSGGTTNPTGSCNSWMQAFRWGMGQSGSSENYSLTNSIIPQFLFSAIPNFLGGSCYGERTAILPLSREPSGGDLLRLPPRHLPPLTPSNCLLHRPIRRLTAILFRLPFRGGGLRPMRTRCRFLFHPSSMTHLSCQSRGAKISNCTTTRFSVVVQLAKSTKSGILQLGSISKMGVRNRHVQNQNKLARNSWVSVLSMHVPKSLPVG